MNLAKSLLTAHGRILTGLTFVLCGILVARLGAARLTDLWALLSANLPFSLPPDAAERIMRSFPLMFNVFISAISALWAALMGLIWIFSGLGEAISPRKSAAAPGGFARPEAVAAALKNSEPYHWASRSWLRSVLTILWPGSRFVSPVSYKILREIVGSIIGLLFLALVISVVLYVLQLVPQLAWKFLQREIALAVPSGRPLYHLVGFVILVDAIAAVSLLPLAARRFERSRRFIGVAGTGEPHLFFALLEEGCRLLNPPGLPAQAPVRLQGGGDAATRATLLESFPATKPSVARPAAYACLPLAALLVVNGFARLVNFPRPVDPMPYAQFFSACFADYAIEAALGIGQIMAGLHFADLARRLFAIRVFVSALVLCQARSTGAAGAGLAQEAGTNRRKTARLNGAEWSTVHGVEAPFAEWARNPAQHGRFAAEVFWAEAVSEAVGGDQARHVKRLAMSPPLDAAMARIVEIPFRVRFEMESVEMEKDPPGPGGEPHPEEYPDKTQTGMTGVDSGSGLR
jgi:hypothetical protein